MGAIQNETKSVGTGENQDGGSLSSLIRKSFFHKYNKVVNMRWGTVLLDKDGVKLSIQIWD